ncbi:MAG: PilZ domain-containing protein [Proteobacteria bacterium]|nr:PilZ domain-containing protein [Pseudomonadota bacterium]
MDNVNVSLSLSPKLIWALSKLAESKNISFTSLCRTILEKALREEEDIKEKKEEIEATRTGNKRKYPRHDLTIPATIAFGGQEINPEEIEMVDISLGGALLAIPKGHILLKSLVNETNTFDLTLTLPDEEDPIQFTSKASRVRKDKEHVHIGLSFDEYSYYDFIKLYNFLG